MLSDFHGVIVTSYVMFLKIFRIDSRASLIGQLVKSPPAMQETLDPFLGWEDPLEKR